MFSLLSTWIYVNDGAGRAVTVSVWCCHTDMVGLSTGESVNCTGGVVHALTVGEMAVTVLNRSCVRSCSCALLPEHGQAIPLAGHISGHIIRHTGHWTWEKWLSVKLIEEQEKFRYIASNYGRFFGTIWFISIYNAYFSNITQTCPDWGSFTGWTGADAVLCCYCGSVWHTTHQHCKITWLTKPWAAVEVKPIIADGPNPVELTDFIAHPWHGGYVITAACTGHQALRDTGNCGLKYTLMTKKRASRGYIAFFTKMIQNRVSNSSKKNKNFSSKWKEVPITFDFL